MKLIISIFLVLPPGHLFLSKGGVPETLFRHLQPVTAKISISPSERAGSPGIYRMEPVRVINGRPR